MSNNDIILMEINNESDPLIESLTAEEAFDASNKAMQILTKLYDDLSRHNDSKRVIYTDSERDFNYGACGILANILYNTFPSWTTVYMKKDRTHVAIKIGSGYQGTGDLDFLELSKAINDGDYYLVDLNKESGKEDFISFLYSCKIRATGTYGEELVRIEKEVKESVHKYLLEEKGKGLEKRLRGNKQWI